MLTTQQYNTYKQIDNKNMAIKQQPARMPKEEAQALSQKLKMATMAASIVAFGVFGGLIAPELQRSAATNTQVQSPSATGSQSTSGNTQAPSSDSQNSGQQQSGYNFGNSGSSTAPGSGTHVS